MTAEKHIFTHDSSEQLVYKPLFQQRIEIADINVSRGVIGNGLKLRLVDSAANAHCKQLDALGTGTLKNKKSKDMLEK